MPTLTLKTIIKAYLTVILILGIIVSTLPQFALAITLLALQLYTTYKPPNPKLNLAIIVGTLILTPLTLTPLTGTAFGALFITPAIYLLDQNLQENAQNQTATPSKRKREPTITLKTFSTALTLTFLTTLTILNITLMLSTTILLAYLATVLSYNLIKIPKNPLQETKIWNRTLAGNPTNNTTDITTSSKLHLSTTLTTTEQWIQIKPSKFTTTNNPQKININYTPPLAGPTKLQIQAATIDPRGLIQTNQTLQPVDLHIIPKARYAQWLAKKYLEQTTVGAASTGSALLRAFKVTRSGVEFYGSRLYQPGDRLKDVDWKHTLMLDELIVKMVAGAQGTPTIIAADMTAKNAQDADKLAHNVVMAALTAAMESLPSGLAMFNQKEVITASAPTNPQETLKKTLQLTEKIRVAEAPLKVMQPAEIHRLKKTLKELSETKSEQSGRFTEILEFEYEAIQTAAKSHPANEALVRCIEWTPAPAMITAALSYRSVNEETLTLVLERLKTRGYSIVTILG
jgi:uncharacterized protein (DUF58 family)